MPSQIQVLGIKLQMCHKFITLVKFGFSEKATKFEKNLHRTFDKSILFCVRKSVLLVKKSTKIFRNSRRIPLSSAFFQNPVGKATFCRVSAAFLTGLLTEIPSRILAELMTSAFPSRILEKLKFVTFQNLCSGL